MVATQDAVDVLTKKFAAMNLSPARRMKDGAPRVTDEDAPTVDVFVPTYNEAIEIVAPTLAAAKRINYPAGKLNVFLLDDGGTEEKLQSDDAATARRALNRRERLQSLCGELGADIEFAILLVGMGLRSMSINPHSIPEVKKIIRSIELEEAQKVARRVMSFENTQQILNYLRDETRKVIPEAYGD